MVTLSQIIEHKISKSLTLLISKEVKLQWGTLLALTQYAPPTEIPSCLRCRVSEPPAPGSAAPKAQNIVAS